MLNREEITASNKNLKRETVFVEEWGGDVIVSEMNGTARDAWEQSLSARGEGQVLENPRARLVVATLLDESGKRIFSDSDVDLVGTLSCFALDKVCSVAQRLNKLRAEDVEEAKGNSKADPSGDSISR